MIFALKWGSCIKKEMKLRKVIYTCKHSGDNQSPFQPYYKDRHKVLMTLGFNVTTYYD